MESIRLDFSGPFTFTEGESSVFRSPYAKSQGIYLWAIKQKEGNYHLIHYIGETTSFAKRQKEHLIHILGLNYGIFDPEKVQSGELEVLWRGLWRIKNADGPGLQMLAYPQLSSVVLGYISVLKIFFAELNVVGDLRKHIEGCIGWNLRNNHKDYDSLYPRDNHVGRKTIQSIGELLISCPADIKGLDQIIKI